jgi:HAD superfamily hydrolase (TIGR01549 family)
MTPIDLKNYNTIIFDCDGVILNSNYVKTSAFYKAALPWGNELALKLRTYHTNNGGISRYEKFKYFLEEIIGPNNQNPQSLALLLQSYAELVHVGINACEIAPNIPQLRAKTLGAKWLVASGSDQSELREIFKSRELDNYFDAGIYGSPKNKTEIIEELITSNQIEGPILFLGDSRYDFEVAKYFSFDFIFIYGWSEFSEWQNYFKPKNIRAVPSLSALI